MRCLVLGARLDGGIIGVAVVISDVVSNPSDHFLQGVVVAMSDQLLPMLEVRLILKGGEMELKSNHDARKEM
jgi:hypothetical protein